MLLQNRYDPLSRRQSQSAPLNSRANNEGGTTNMKRGFFGAKALWIFILLLSFVSRSLAAGDTWTKKADMPTGRLGLSTSAVSGKIYAIGGSPPGGLGFSTVEAYDSATDT